MSASCRHVVRQLVCNASCAFVNVEDRHEARGCKTLLSRTYQLLSQVKQRTDSTMRSVDKAALVVGGSKGVGLAV